MQQSKIPLEEKKASSFDLAQRIALARAEAVHAPVYPDEGPEWPSTSAYSLEEAQVELTVQCYTLGAKVSFGVTGEATSVWGRISFPKWANNKEVAGMSALTFSSELGKCMIKLAQLIDDPVNAKFRPDPYAK
jgi:hypothetical protein